MKERYVIGIDYGSDSCRGVIISTVDGRELASKVFYYPRWKKGLYCDPNRAQFRQHPLDYIEGLKDVVQDIVKQVTRTIVNQIVGISIDTTGSTPCAVNEKGIPLALLPEFEDNPNGMFILWKDHTAVKEAEEITRTAKTWGGVDYTKYIGGIYSSEWFWAKILHTLRVDERVRKSAYSWVEHCDWIPALLTGNENPLAMKRSRCAAGHKGMWHKEFKGLPSEDFLNQIDPLLGGLRERLYEETYTSDNVAGVMTDEWAEILGLPQGIKVGIGAFDCHMGAVGGNIKPKALVKVMGTSTCDVMMEEMSVMGETLVEGICGQVDGSVITGMLGMEAGQSAFG
ncbi:MAG: ribulokinase, partial [Cellulosilyticaceae bacterium]